MLPTVWTGSFEVIFEELNWIPTRCAEYFVNVLRGPIPRILPRTPCTRHSPCDLRTYSTTDLVSACSRPHARLDSGEVNITELRLENWLGGEESSGPERYRWVEFALVPFLLARTVKVVDCVTARMFQTRAFCEVPR